MGEPEGRPRNEAPGQLRLNAELCTHSCHTEGRTEEAHGTYIPDTKARLLFLSF